MAVQKLVTHHDALRLRCRWEEGRCHQFQLEDEPQNAFTLADLNGLSASEQSTAIEDCAGQIQASLSLTEGPMIRVGLFETTIGAGRLLIVIHHLAVDRVSWSVLLEDLLSAYRQAGSGQSIELPAKTTSFREWAKRLGDFARTPELEPDRGYWEKVVAHPIARLPVNFASGVNDAASMETVVVSLSDTETRELLQQVPAAYRTQINDVLLTALAQAFSRWTGQDSLLVSLEGHGREPLFEDVDLSRTVGWFTSLFPIRLTLDGASEPGAALKSIKEQLRRIPRKGISYGLIRYLDGDAQLAARLGSLSPEVSFNYFGQLDQLIPPGAPLGIAPESAGPFQSLRARRAHLLDVSGRVQGGRLQVVWMYSRNRHLRSTIDGLAASFAHRLRALIEHCRLPESFGYTPSDFELVEIDQATLDRVAGAARDIEDIYPLAPLQSGMLFHSLFAPDSGMYFEQLACRISGETFNADSFRRAWQKAIDRHSILRTAFVSEGVSGTEALQVVRRRASLPWEFQDWRALGSTEQGRNLESFLETDRNRGLDLTQAPLMRCALIRVAEDGWHFVWSYHHLVVDGWSMPLLLREVLLSYRSLALGRNLALTGIWPLRRALTSSVRDRIGTTSPGSACRTRPNPRGTGRRLFAVSRRPPPCLSNVGSPSATTRTGTERASSRWPPCRPRAWKVRPADIS